MIFVKISGILSIFVASALWGIFSSFSLKNRAKNLDSICKGISVLKNLINHSGKELESALNQSFSDCNFLSFKGIEPIISASSLKVKDKETLREFLSVLGTSERKSESEKIELYLEIFENESRKAKQEAEQKCKIFTVSGICIGLTAAILFI